MFMEDIPNKFAATSINMYTKYLHNTHPTYLHMYKAKTTRINQIRFSGKMKYLYNNELSIFLLQCTYHYFGNENIIYKPASHRQTTQSKNTKKKKHMQENFRADKIW